MALIYQPGSVEWAQQLAAPTQPNPDTKEKEQAWVSPWGGASPLKNAVSVLERDYEETKNPIFIWLAIKILRDADLDPYGLKWIDGYLKETAENLTKLSNTLPDPKKVSTTIVKAIGFRAKPFSTAKTRLRNRRLGFQVLHCPLRTNKDEAAIAAVAEKENLEVGTVGAAWRAFKKNAEL